MIFQTEGKLRQRALDAQSKAESSAKIAVDKMHELEQRIENLEKDKAKAMQLSMKAIAARSNIKSYLDDEKNRNGQLGGQIVML